MPNVAQVLKEEISRVAKKEARTLIQPLTKQIRDLKATVRDQKQQISQLEKKLSNKPENVVDGQIVPEEVDESANIRIPKGSIKKVRDRFNITQREMALLLNVSPLTISHWELDKSSPRGKNKIAFAELRSMGLMEVKARLETLEEV